MTDPHTFDAESELFKMGTPFMAPMRMGLGSLHWRFKCYVWCRKCGAKKGIVWACPKVRNAPREFPPYWECVNVRKPTTEMIVTGIMLAAHNQLVGHPERHHPGCPTGKRPTGRHHLAGFRAGHKLGAG